MTHQRVSSWWIIGACLLALIVPFIHSETAAAQETIDLAWDWEPGDSGYTAGPDGDVVFDIYMRTDDQNGYAYDYPVIGVVDDCVWDSDRYRCRTTLEYGFDPGTYHFVSVAYLVDSPDQRSISSNEAAYVVGDGGGPSTSASSSDGGSGGGGCFLGTVMQMDRRP